MYSHVFSAHSPHCAGGKDDCHSSFVFYMQNLTQNKVPYGRWVSGLSAAPSAGPPAHTTRRRIGEGGGGIS